MFESLEHEKTIYEYIADTHKPTDIQVVDKIVANCFGRQQGRQSMSKMIHLQVHESRDIADQAGESDKQFISTNSIQASPLSVNNSTSKENKFKKKVEEIIEEKRNSLDHILKKEKKTIEGDDELSQSSNLNFEQEDINSQEKNMEFNLANRMLKSEIYFGQDVQSHLFQESTKEVVRLS